MTTKRTTTTREARTPRKRPRGGKINFSDFRPEDYLKTEESIRAFEAASEKDDTDLAFIAIVNDIAGRARKRLKIARSRTKRRA